jgi:phospholipid-binding lipoprotein MlaA
MKLEKRAEDLGQTLGVWGVRPGPFLMLPLLGPSSLRDGIALPADRWLSPSLLTRSDGKRFLGTALNVVDTRARLLSTTSMIEDVALDRYSFVRDGYFARRRDLVWDGAPPLEDFVDEPPFPASKPAPAPPR